MDIVEELRDTAERITRYTNSPHDGLMDAAADEIERLQKVVEAARCIRHWHDSDNDGMVVSGEHVRALWQALHDLDEVPNA